MGYDIEKCPFLSIVCFSVSPLHIGKAWFVDLKIKDVAELLQVSEKTIYRWIKENKIPSMRINWQYRFNRDAINEWVLKNNISVAEPIFDETESTKKADIVECLRKGGIHYKVAGSTVEEILKNAVALINAPPGLDKETIVWHLLKREAMMTTALGSGIAIPHPRTPLISDISCESVSMCFLNGPVDFKALDNMPVSVLFIVLSANQPRHLQILSQISHLCRKDGFMELIKRQALREEIFDYAGKEKKSWEHHQV